MLRFLRGPRRPRRLALLGNHDLHLIARAFGSPAPKPLDTVEDQCSTAPDRDEIVDWLIPQRPLAPPREDRAPAMVHAGIPHIWNFDVAWNARRSRTSARSDECGALLAEMYGNYPACWSDGLKGMERTRSIINYLTRMRLIDAVGVLELTYDGGLEGMPRGYDAWFDFYRAKRPRLPVSSAIGRRSTAVRRRRHVRIGYGLRLGQQAHRAAPRRS